MHTTINLDFKTGPVSRRGPHCTPEQARQLLEGLRAAYQSLLPTERIVIRDMVAQSARTKFTQEMNARKRRPPGRVLKSDDIWRPGVEQLRKHQ
jgi:hypothetical protein